MEILLYLINVTSKYYLKELKKIITAALMEKTAHTSNAYNCEWLENADSNFVDSFNAWLSCMFSYVKERLYDFNGEDREILNRFIEHESANGGMGESVANIVSPFIFKEFLMGIWAVVLIVGLMALVVGLKSKVSFFGSVASFISICALCLKIVSFHYAALGLASFYKATPDSESWPRSDFTMMPRYYPWPILAMELLVLSILVWKILDYFLGCFRLKYLYTLPFKIAYFISAMSLSVVFINHLTITAKGKLPFLISPGICLEAFTQYFFLSIKISFYTCLIALICAAFDHWYLSSYKKKAVDTIKENGVKQVNTESNDEICVDEFVCSIQPRKK